MKYFLLYCLLCISNSSYCQYTDTTHIPALPLTENRIVYTGQISADTSIGKEQLFHSAEEWYTHNFESADNTLSIANLTTGKISGTGIIHVKKKERRTEPGDVFFTIDIIVTQGGYEYKIYSIYGIDNSTKFYYSDMYNEALYPSSKPKWSKNYKLIMLTSMNTRIQQTIAKMQADLPAKK